VGLGLELLRRGRYWRRGLRGREGIGGARGKAGIVAGAIRRKATALRLDASQRKKADECARYLKNKAPYLDYPTALARGWPIATGVIEGAVRHIVRDRFDITGARWSLDGAEAMLKLRAVRANGDWSRTGATTSPTSASGYTQPAMPPVSSPKRRDHSLQGSHTHM